MSSSLWFYSFICFVFVVSSSFTSKFLINKTVILALIMLKLTFRRTPMVTMWIQLALVLMKRFTWLHVIRSLKYGIQKPKKKRKNSLWWYFSAFYLYIYINNSDSFPNQWSVLNINIQNYKSAGNTPMLSRSSQLAFDFFPVSKNIKQYYKHMEKEKENLGQKEKGNLYCITAFLYSLATKYQT